MRDCKEHYAKMYEVRMGTAGCPFCEVVALKAQLAEQDELLVLATFENESLKEPKNHCTHRIVMATGYPHGVCTECAEAMQEDSDASN
jgi:hypothetical protein